MDLNILREVASELDTRIETSIHPGNDVVGLTVRASTNARYEKYEKILEKYKTNELIIDLYRLRDKRLEIEYFRRIDFINLRDCMALGIRGDIQELIDNPPVDAIYAFSVAISPAHNGCGCSANSEEEWSKKAKDYPQSSKYVAAEFTLHHAKGTEHWRPYWDAVAKIEAITGEYYKLADDSLSEYEKTFTQMAVHALKQNIMYLENINKTVDFVAYVEDYIVGQDPFFLALETVPYETVKKMMPEYFDPM